MDKPIIIQLEPTTEIVNLLHALIKSSAVMASNEANPLDEYLTRSEAAQEFGDVRILRRHLREFAEGNTSASPEEARKSP